MVNTLMKFAVMKQSNVSFAKCGQLLKTIFKKMVNVDLDKVPQKSLAATMLVEIEALSKMQVFEEIEKGDQNILHIDGTKYKHRVWVIYIRSRKYVLWRGPNILRHF